MPSRAAQARKPRVSKKSLAAIATKIGGIVSGRMPSGPRNVAPGMSVRTQSHACPKPNTNATINEQAPSSSDRTIVLRSYSLARS
jgi:hypothetical protein